MFNKTLPPELKAAIFSFFSKRIVFDGHLSKNWYTERVQAIVEIYEKYRGPQLTFVVRWLKDMNHR